MLENVRIIPKPTNGEQRDGRFCFIPDMYLCRVRCRGIKRYYVRLMNMSEEAYKEYIKQMLSCIHNERDLQQIYTIVHRKFIKTEPGALVNSEGEE